MKPSFKERIGGNEQQREHQCEGRRYQPHQQAANQRTAGLLFSSLTKQLQAIDHEPHRRQHAEANQNHRQIFKPARQVPGDRQRQNTDAEQNGQKRGKTGGLNRRQDTEDREHSREDDVRLCTACGLRTSRHPITANPSIARLTPGACL